MTFPRPVRLLLRALALTLPLLGGCAITPPAPPDADPGKAQALDEFVVVYRLAQAWPPMAPKIAHDSLPRLEDAIHADLDADHLAPAADAAAHARVPALLVAGRKALESALLAFDADELAHYTAHAIYGRYFDSAEIREINAFYGSPTGLKLTAIAPELISERRRTGTDAAALARHFDAAERAQLDAFFNSAVAMKLNRTAEQVREDMHAHFIEASEPALQAVARTLATQAEASGTTPSK